jgi:hypothetical protein
MWNTVEWSEAREMRRIAIQRQMEAMQAATSSRSGARPSRAVVESLVGPRGQTGTTRRRGTTSADSSTQQQDTMDIARRFLWDEDDDEGPSKADDCIQDPSESTCGLIGSFVAIFRGGGKSLPAEIQQHMGGSGEDPYRPSLLTSCYIFFRRLVLRFALAMGSCFTWIRTRWSLAMGNGRERKLCLALTIVLLIVIPVAIFLPKGSSGGSTSSLSGSSRYDAISNRIAASGITPQDILVKQNSPQNKALNWIVAEDPAQLDPNDAFILPRYSLAVFYFSTHGNEMFQVATINVTQTIPPQDENTDVDAGESALKPPAEGETTKLGDDLAAQPNWVRESGWLSGQGYCSWFGVECHHREGTSIYNTRYDDNNGLILLNMTENNVRGKVPREIFLANPDIRWFSVSGNGFFGEVPSEIGALTQMRK